MAAAFSAMEPSSVKIYHTSTTGSTTPSKGSSSPGRLAAAMPSTASVNALTSTTTSIPALCQMPARAAALDHCPRLAAAALPLSQSSAMQAAHAAMSHPSQPKAAVNAPQAAQTAALPHKNTLRSPTPCSFPGVTPTCLCTAPPPSDPGRRTGLSPRRRHPG